MKQCSRCHKTKPFTDYYKQSANKDGLKAMCKECIGQSKKTVRYRINPHPAPKTYFDYLREAGMTEYYKRYTKHFS